MKPLMILPVMKNTVFCLQYSNMYVATPKLPSLMGNFELQQCCVQYVATAGELCTK